MHRNFLENLKEHTTSSVSAEKGNENRLVSHIIAGVQTQAKMNLYWQEETPIYLPMGAGNKYLLKIEAVLIQT